MSECSVEHLRWGATWPTREQFHELADQGYRVIPIVRRLLADSLTPVGFYERLAGGRSGTFIRRIRRHLEPVQLHRRAVDGAAAFERGTGRLAGTGACRRADARRRDRGRARRAQDAERPARRRTAEPDQRSGRHGRLGRDPPLGAYPARRGAGRDRTAGDRARPGHRHRRGRPRVGLGMDDRQRS